MTIPQDPHLCIDLHCHSTASDGALSPAALVERARSLCAGGGYCRVQGWSDPAQVPASLPLSDAARRSLRFSFAAANANGGEAIFFDCRLFSAPDIGTCLPAIP